MAYAKKCKYCNNVQVVWDEHLPGGNKFKEVQTNQPHTRERCDAAKNTPPEQQVPMYNPREEKEFVDSYRPPPKQSVSIQSSDIDVTLRSAISKIDNLAIGMQKLMGMVQTLNDLSLTAEDISRLRTENAELRVVLTKKGLVTPANELLKPEPDSFAIRENEESQSQQEDKDYDQHVRDMVEEGKQETENNEELEL